MLQQDTMTIAVNSIAKVKEEKQLDDFSFKLSMQAVPTGFGVATRNYLDA
jgi:hypothetical protein